MNAAARLRNRHALNAVNAALKLQMRPHLGSGNLNHHLFDATAFRDARVDGFDRPSLGLGITRIHSQKISGKKAGFVSPGAGADFQDDVAVFIRVFGQNRQLQLLFQRRQFSIQFRKVVSGQFLQFGVGRLSERQKILFFS